MGWKRKDLLGMQDLDASEITDVLDTFRMAARYPFVDVALSYNGRNNDAQTGVFNNNFGLLNYDLSPKPSYASVSNAWACLRAGTC